MIIYVDIDNTICKTNGTDYENAEPYTSKIDKINKLYDDGHQIVYWTARGSGSGIDRTELTLNQLKAWGCKYHQMRLWKPAYDVFIDDKSFSDIDNFC
jgi:hypothetical protein